MNDLIIGGIYSKDNQYIVVVEKDFADDYVVTFFNDYQFTQKDLLTIQSITNVSLEFYYIHSKSRKMSYYFDNGYCGKITKKFLDKLIDRSYLSIPHQL